MDGYICLNNTVLLSQQCINQFECWLLISQNEMLMDSLLYHSDWVINILKTNYCICEIHMIKIWTTIDEISIFVMAEYQSPTYIFYKVILVIPRLQHPPKFIKFTTTNKSTTIHLYYTEQSALRV